jgi:hypothetical protein
MTTLQTFALIALPQILAFVVGTLYTYWQYRDRD